MAELVEIFQWLSEEQSRQLSSEGLQHAGEEMAILCSTCYRNELGIDMEQVVRAKLANNERRFS